jgi:hypothetical protein
MFPDGMGRFVQVSIVREITDGFSFALHLSPLLG